jgi:hypothetical protein
MHLSFSEKKAVSGLLSQLDHNTFQLLLARDAKLPGVHIFSALTNPMPMIAFAFVLWLDKNPQAVEPALEVILSEFGALPAAQELSLALERIRAGGTLRMQAQPPWEMALIEGVPVINRLRLRELLKRIVDNKGPPVVLVDGPAGTGRSHSFYLINHVAASYGHKLVKMDIAYLPPDGRNLTAIVEKLVRDLQLVGFSHPSSVGATPATVGWRYADSFASALKQDSTLHATWFVFDSLEKHPLAEVRDFVHTLIDLRLRQEVGNCVFFLLGAGPDYLPTDDLQRIESDPVGIFSRGEVEQYVAILNSLGTMPLDAPRLAQRANDITALLDQIPAREVCRNISKKIAVLRKEVNA